MQSRCCFGQVAMSPGPGVVVIDELEPASLAEAAKQPTHPERRGWEPWARYYYGSQRAETPAWVLEIAVCVGFCGRGSELFEDLPSARLR